MGCGMGSGASKTSQADSPKPAAPAAATAAGDDAVARDKSAASTAPSSKQSSQEVSKQKSTKSQGSEFFTRKASDSDTPLGALEARRVSLDIRTFMPERYEANVAERYNIDKDKVGEGGYGQVFIARDKQVEGRLVCIKRINKTGDTAALYAEVKLMKDLDHPNICKLLETFESKGHIFFVMEYCEGGEVFERIVQNGYIDEDWTASIVLQVAQALRYAHGRKIAHRDVKPENIVFCTKNANDQNIKVIDWGLGICFENEAIRGAVGSFTYAAPEVVSCSNSGDYTPMCDLWSLGVVAYVMLCGKPPFWGSQRDHLRKARAEQYPMERAPWDKISDNAKDFVRKLLKADPTKRLPIDQVSQHPWLTEITGGARGEEITQVLTNLKDFTSTSRFQAMCVAAVARQLDHRCLRRVHRVFRELDTSGTGVLTFQEVSDGFKKIYGEQSKEFKEVAQTFAQMDLDGSGTIDYTEFCAAGMGQYANLQDDAVWAAFKSFDLDDSGSISKENLEKILGDAGVLQAWSEDVCKEVAQEMVERFDANGSGAIDYQDWKEIMRSCWEEHTMETKAADEQPSGLMKSISTRSVTSTGSLRHDNKVTWAYNALSEASGLNAGE